MVVLGVWIHDVAQLNQPSMEFINERENFLQDDRHAFILLKVVLDVCHYYDLKSFLVNLVAFYYFHP